MATRSGPERDRFLRSSPGGKPISISPGSDSPTLPRGPLPLRGSSFSARAETGRPSCWSGCASRPASGECGPSASGPGPSGARNTWFGICGTGPGSRAATLPGGKSPRSALRRSLKRRAGTVSICSLRGFAPIPHRSSFCSTKHTPLRPKPRGISSRRPRSPGAKNCRSSSWPLERPTPREHSDEPEPSRNGCSSAGVSAASTRKQPRQRLLYRRNAGGFRWMPQP